MYIYIYTYIYRYIYIYVYSRRFFLHERKTTSVNAHHRVQRLGYNRPVYAGTRFNYGTANCRRFEFRLINIAQSKFV